MDSTVTVFEVQNDFSVIQREVPLMFPRGSKSRLYIVTNRNTDLLLLNNSVGSPRTEEGGDRSHQKKIFRYGVSTKVFAVTDPTGTAQEVRLLLSPSEISRLSSNYNLTGFVSSCLTMEKYQDCLSSLCDDHTRREADVQEFCMAAAQFLSYSEDNIVNDYCKKLNRILTEKVGSPCVGHEKMADVVVGALVALMAAQLASSVGGARSFDYIVEKEKAQEDQREQIQEMIKVFDVMADLLTVSHQGKRVQVIFRNPCPDNWASGGKKLVNSGETFVFGLCHKVVSISEAESEIQFLQNLQESYDLVPVFHLPAFVEHLLMTSAWRKKIEHFLKNQDQRKEIIDELSSLAEGFICSKTCHRESFLKEFQREMLGKWSSVGVLVGDEVICAFGILVAILAAVTAKSNVDKCIPNSEEELVDTNGSTALEMKVSAGSSSPPLEDEVIVTQMNDEYGGAQPDLGSGPDDWVTIGDMGDKSRIGSTNDPGTTDQESINCSPKTPAEPPGVRTLDITDQETDNNDAKYPGARDCARGSSPTIDASDQGSIIASPKTGNPPVEPPGVRTLDITDKETDNDDAKYAGARDYAHGSSSTSPTIDASDQGSINVFPKTSEPPAEPSGVSTLGIANQDTDDHDAAYPGARDYAHGSSPTSPTIDASNQGSIIASLKTGNPPVEPPGVRTLDITDQETDDHDAEYPGARDYDHGSSHTSPDAGRALHSKSSGGGPSLDGSSDGGACRVAQPPSIRAQDNVLETQGSSSMNRIFSTSFMGLLGLLVVAAMLTSVLPRPVSSVLVAIILGVLVVKWLMSWQS